MTITKDLQKASPLVVVANLYFDSSEDKECQLIVARDPWRVSPFVIVTGFHFDSSENDKCLLAITKGL